MTACVCLCGEAASHKAQVCLLYVQLELQGMLETVHGPLPAFRRARGVLCSPASHMPGRASQLACANSILQMLLARACKGSC